MACRSDKVETSVNSKVRLVLSLWLLLLSHVHFMLIVEKVDNGSPAVSIVDVVAKARRINDSQFHLELLLLELSLDNVDLDSLVQLLLMTKRVVLSSRQFSREESIDEGSLANAALTDDHEGKVTARFCDNLVPLIGQIRNA